MGQYLATLTLIRPSGLVQKLEAAREVQTFVPYGPRHGGGQPDRRVLCHERRARRRPPRDAFVGTLVDMDV
jgi:hypothetical protein